MVFNKSETFFGEPSDTSPFEDQFLPIIESFPHIVWPYNDLTEQRPYQECGEPGEALLAT